MPGHSATGDVSIQVLVSLSGSNEAGVQCVSSIKCGKHFKNSGSVWSFQLFQLHIDIAMSSGIIVDLVIKLGGSAITAKDQLETLKPDCLKEAAILVRKCVEKKRKIVIVHGAGSFGHHQAKEYQVNTGFVHLEGEAANRARMGVCLTHRSVSKLNSHVINSLLDHDVPVITCSPCSSWMTRQRSVTLSGVEMVRQFVQTGFVPVLHGDAVRDTNIGGCILSGDTIIKTLCQEFVVGQVVFLTDVGGVYDRPPNQTGAVLLPRIEVRQDGSVVTGISTSLSVHDVTGGIQLKIQSAVDIVMASQGRTRVHVCKLGSESSHQLCLEESCDRTSIEATEIVIQK